MSRSVWWPVRLKVGQVVPFQNKIYKVVAQELQARDSYHFKARYYTTLSQVEKMHWDAELDSILDSVILEHNSKLAR